MSPLIRSEKAVKMCPLHHFCHMSAIPQMPLIFFLCPLTRHKGQESMIADVLLIQDFYAAVAFMQFGRHLSNLLIQYNRNC